jgi:nitrate reductase NapE
MSEENRVQEDRSQRLTEWSTFLFVTLIVFPGLAVAFVGGYGFIVWMMQLINGPPIAG